jgi:hypothetical protein
MATQARKAVCLTNPLSGVVVNLGEQQELPVPGACEATPARKALDDWLTHEIQEKKEIALAAAHLRSMRQSQRLAFAMHFGPRSVPACSLEELATFAVKHKAETRLALDHLLRPIFPPTPVATRVILDLSSDAEERDGDEVLDATPPSPPPSKRQRIH